MPLDDSDISLPSATDKGKRRADTPTERTPLLQNGTHGSTSRDIPLLIDPPASRRRLRSVLTTVFLVSFSVCLLIAVISVLFAWSYASRVSRLVPEELLNKDVVLSGPFRVDVLNTTNDGGLWLNVSGLVGFDAGDAMGFNHLPPGENEMPLSQVWKALGRWGIRTLDTVTVDLDTVDVAPEDDRLHKLLEVKLPTIELPLTVDPSRHSGGWLTPMALEMFVQPTKNSTLLADFVYKSWREGTVNINTRLAELRIIGGGSESSWKANFHGKMTNVQTSIQLKIPPLRGLPQPGKNVPFPSVSDFLTLKSFRVSSQHNLTLYAEADVINPCPNSFNFSIPSLPFIVSLPNDTNSPLPVANIITHPFVSTHPNITIQVSGTVPALPQSSSPLLSAFLSRFLNAKPSQILISTPLLSSNDSSEGRGIQIPAEFPALSHRPNLLRNVTIKDMKIRPSGTAFLASGIVFAKVVLPKGIDVGVDVFRVFTDVLVFDGEVPEDLQQIEAWWPHLPHLPSMKPGPHRVEKKRALPQMPSLPDPLPPRAFGHIRPEDWLPSTSVRLESDGFGDEKDDGDAEETGAVYIVSAKVADVPLQVLPGREREFSNFVGKVIFGSGGAVAGIEGYAAVKVKVDGLPLDIGGGKGNGENGATLELTGLPVRGSVRVGKKGLLGVLY